MALDNVTDDKIYNSLLDLRNRVDSEPKITPKNIRNFIFQEFPRAYNTERFKDWLNCKWCKYEHRPDWEDWRVLEESLNKLYEI